MIEFNGYISGAAEKRFWKKNIQIGQNIMLFGALFMLPGTIAMAYSMRMSIIFYIHFGIVLAIPILARIPKSKKEKLSLLPRRIYIEDECIVCKKNIGEERKWIEDVKQVWEYDEFYELVFPVGKISPNFICQKNLLSQGTLEQFEALFDGRIVHK